MKKKSILNTIFLFLFLLLVSFFYIYYLHSLWDRFEKLCINKDFLTWDPELRFIITLKMMDNLRNGNVFAYLVQIFDSPHWPSLRNVIESILFFITSPSPKATIALTFAFYCLLPLAILWTLIKENIHPILQGAFYLLGIFGLLQAESLQLYAFTGMIELQGAFLFVFASYYLSKVYLEDLSDNTKLGWKVFFSTTLLYHSKYPYGYMLILCIFFIEVFFFPKNTWEYGKKYLEKRKKNWYKNYRLWFVLICFLTLLLPKTLLTGKLPNYLMYGIVLFLFIDLFTFFYQEPNTKFNTRLHFLMKWFLFPILFWMLSQPDRFGSYSGQITHVESQGSNPGEAIAKDLDYYLLFINEFLLNGFQNFAIAYLLFFSNLFIVVWGAYRYVKEKKLSISFLIALLSFLTFVELSLFTTNRLARHTYHLFPALFVSIFLFLGDYFHQFPKKTIVFTIFLSVIISYPIALKPFQLTSQVEVCYTGYDTGDYFTPRWIEEKSKEKMQKPLIVLNEVNPLHVNKADTEYLLSWLAFERKISIQFDPKRWKKVEPKWEELWVVGNTCITEKFEEKQAFWESFGFFKQNAYRYESEFGCIQIIERKKNQ